MNTRAKFKVTSVTPNGDLTQPGSSVSVSMCAVSDAPFDKDGVSEDNSFARWTPCGSLSMTITNPALFAQFKPDQKYYLDLTEATA